MLGTPKVDHSEKDDEAERSRRFSPNPKVYTPAMIFNLPIKATKLMSWNIITVISVLFYNLLYIE